MTQSVDVKATERPWLLFNVGCIECGVSSNVVGLFATEQEALVAMAKCEKELSWREGGQNSFEVFDLRLKMADEYVAALSTSGAE